MAAWCCGAACSSHSLAIGARPQRLAVQLCPGHGLARRPAGRLETWRGRVRLDVGGVRRPPGKTT